MELFRRYGKLLIIILMIVTLALSAVIVNMMINGKDLPRIFGAATEKSPDKGGEQSGITPPDSTAGGDITGTGTGTGENTGTVATTVPQPTEKRLSFLAVGDNIIHECVYLDAMTRAETAVSAGTYAGKYFFDSMYSGVANRIAAADISFVNTECPIAGDSYKVRGYPNFNAPIESGESLVRLGFDVINLANNHILDMENITTGYKNTINFWKSQPVVTVGGYESAADMNNIRIVTLDGVKIAVLAYTYGTNVKKINAATGAYVVPYINDDNIKKQIAAAKTQADLVFVSMHWGTENKFPVTAEQKRLAQLIADCGADVIIGHHPHVIQSIEWLTGSGGNKTLCAYSLGNFISTQLQAYNMVGGLFTFDIVKSADGSRVYIENPVFIPTVCHYSTDTSRLDSQSLFMRYGVQIYLMSDYTEAQAAAHGAQAFVSSKFTLATLRGYVTDAISAEFLK